MLWLAYILLAMVLAYALYQRARRKAAEWDRDNADRAAEQADAEWDAEIAEARKERDEAQAEAAKLAAAVESCRLHTRVAMDERDKLAREIGVLRGHQEQTARSHGDSVRCAAERERLVEGYARDILTALGREAP